MQKPILISTLILAAVCSTATAQTVLFFDDFESGVLNSTFWRSVTQAGGIAGVVSLIQDVEVAEDGVFGIALGRASDGSSTISAVDLRLNLAAYQGKDVELSFGISDVSDQTSTLDGLFFSSNGGATFKKVFDFDPSNWTDQVYGHFPPIDVDRLAAANGLSLTGNFVIRFQQHGDRDFSGSRDGILIDNVAVISPSVTWARPPFMDDFESGQLATSWSWSNPLDTAPEGTLQPQGLVGVVSTFQGVEAAEEGVYGVAMGRTQDGPATSNALDLHLNLAGKSQVQLDFSIRDQSDETHVHDGIWFSDDAGQTFKKVFAFDPDLWNHGEWGRFPPLDVDQLAAENNLSLTNRFIIRFQQYGDRDFSGSSDGFLLDNVAVTVPVLTWARMPFRDDFETGRLRPTWTWSDPSLTSPAGSLRPQGVAAVVANIQGVEAAREGVFGLALGRTSDGGPAANALDLHLNLSGQNQALLRFWLSDNSDNTDVLDGIWFSDDAGQSFKKVYDFEPSAATDNSFQMVSLDVDVMARENGLQLSNRFIIRFQQYGDRDFSGSRDGLFLDDVSVTASANTPSCSGHAVFDGASGIITIPDVRVGNSCFAVRMRRLNQEGFVFEAIGAIPAQ